MIRAQDGNRVLFACSNKSWDAGKRLYKLEDIRVSQTLLLD